MCQYDACIVQRIAPHLMNICLISLGHSRITGWSAPSPHPPSHYTMQRIRGDQSVHLNSFQCNVYHIRGVNSAWYFYFWVQFSLEGRCFFSRRLFIMDLYAFSSRKHEDKLFLLSKYSEWRGLKEWTLRELSHQCKGWISSVCGDELRLWMYWQKNLCRKGLVATIQWSYQLLRS